MPPYQPVNSSFARPIVVRVALAIAFVLTSACSGSAEKAMAYAAQAQSLLEQNRTAEARIAVAKAIAQRDDIVDVQLLRARIELAGGSQNAAYVAYNDALSLDSSNGEALMGVAQFGLRTGHLDDAATAAGQLLALYPHQPDAELVMGLINVLRHRGDAALANANNVLATKPNDESGNLLKGRALYMLGQKDEAIAAILHARDVAGSTAGVSQALVEVYRDRRDGRATADELDKLRTAQPDVASVTIDEANVLYKLGDTARARLLIAGLALDPKSNDQTAARVFDLVAEYDPAGLNPAALGAWGAKAALPMKLAAARYFLDTGRPDMADAALKGVPNVDDARALRAGIAVARGDVTGGGQQAAEILSRDQTNCDALVAKAQAAVALRRFGDGVIAGQSAIAACPQLDAAYIVLANAKLGAPNAGAAAADIVYRDGVNAKPQSLPLARSYGAWLESRGQIDRAVANARRLTQRTPALTGGWLYYCDLCQRHPEAGCAADATAGLAASRRTFGIDLRPGESAPTRLFGSLNDN